MERGNAEGEGRGAEEEEEVRGLRKCNAVVLSDCPTTL